MRSIQFDFGELNQITKVLHLSFPVLKSVFEPAIISRRACACASYFFRVRNITIDGMNSFAIKVGNND